MSEKLLLVPQGAIPAAGEEISPRDKLQLLSRPAPVTDRNIDGAIKYLTKHPEVITPELRIRLLEYLISMDVNDAEILIKSDLDELGKTNATQRHLTELYLNGAALAFGRRLIDDSKVQAALRRARENRQLARGSFLKKIIYLIREVISSDEQKFAEILREAEELLAHNEAVKLESKRLLAVNEKTSKEINTAIETTATNARAILENAQNESRRKSEEMLTATRQDLQRLKREQEKLKRENRQLEELKTKTLEENPGIAGSLELSGACSLDTLKNNLSIGLKQLTLFKISVHQTYAYDIAEQFVQFLDKNVLAIIDESDEKLGLEMRGSILNNITIPDFSLHLSWVKNDVGTRCPPNSIKHYYNDNVDLKTQTCSLCRTLVPLVEYRTIQEIIGSLCFTVTRTEDIRNMMKNWLLEVKGAKMPLDVTEVKRLCDMSWSQINILARKNAIK